MLPAAVATAMERERGGPIDLLAPPDSGVRTATARVRIGGAERLVKWETAAATNGIGPCGAEVRGLQLLADAGVVRVPRVELAAEATADCPAFFVAEWIASPAYPDRQSAGAALGRQLAALHQRSAPAYGLDHDNFCGATPQLNGWDRSWAAFYREWRLRPQLELGVHQGRMPPQRRRRLERLMERLDDLLGARPEPPALLHGDLWGGNWLVDEAGAPVLIDPAVSYGHREAELALCHLFGGFPSTFFAAYDEAAPPLPGRAERLPLYQLYHLLNHLNLFGESYAGDVDRVLQRYAG